MDATRALNGVAEVWAQWAVAGLIESAVLLAIVGVILLIGGRRIPAAAAYWMLLLVLVKAVLPIGFEVPVGRSWWPATEQFVACGAKHTPNNVRKSDAGSKTMIAESSAKTSARMPASSQAPLTAQASASVRANHADPVIGVEGLREALTWQSLALLVWSGVVVVLFLRMGVGHLRLGRALRFAEPLDLSRFDINLAELVATLEVIRPVRAVTGPEHAAPAVSGIWRPTLVLPRGIETQLTAVQLRWVILHELAHVRRGDLVVSLLVRLVQVGTFFNPATWIAARMAEHYRECACDDLALRHAGCDRVRCGEAFLSILSTMVTAEQPALAFFSTHRLARRRFVRLLDTRPDGARRSRWPVAVAMTAAVVCANASVSQRRVAAVAVEAVAVDSIVSDSASAEGPTAEATNPAAVPKESNARLVRTVNRIWDEQLQAASPTSVKVRYRQLRLSKYHKDPLQQGHDLIDLSWKDAVKMLESIDLVNDPRALRKVRDRFLLGGLILDQPAAKVILFHWEGDKLRVDLNKGEYVVLAGHTKIHHRPNERQADIGTGHYSGDATLLLEDRTLRWSFLRLPVNTLRLWSDRVLMHAVTNVDGSSRVEFGTTATQRSGVGPVPAGWKLTWQIDRDGRLDRVETVRNREWSRELEFTKYPGGGYLPKVRIDTTAAGPQPDDGDPQFGRLRDLTISIIEEAEFNQSIPPETFQAAVPANTAVWDRRTELKLRAAEQPVSDVLTLFER